MSDPTCPYCGQPAKLVGGDAIYPHRSDLFDLAFWQCAPCDAYVGCHKKGVTFLMNKRQVRSDGTIPLGRLANAQLRKAKSAAHAAFDPLWKSGRMTRREAYAWLATTLGISSDNCHIGMMDADACQAVVSAVEGGAS
jgi:hypothetical protein